MKIRFACLFFIGFLLSACTFSVELMTPESPPSATLTATPTVSTPVVTPSFTPSTTPNSPTQTPDQAGPRFFNARLGSSPSDDSFRSLFPAATKQVYAIWDYENMKDGLLIRREWYLDGKLWLQREEPWDFAKYGANGTMRDVSIYDLEVGLPAGSYELRLFVDNVQQPIGSDLNTPIDTWVRFIIVSDTAYAGYSSPDSRWIAKVVGQKTLVVHDSGGTPHELFVGREIPYVAWFPNSRYILFVNRDRSGQQEGTNLGIRDELWVVKVTGGDAYLLYRSNAGFAGTTGPMPSPDGRYIASIEGSGYQDACFVDSRLIFLELEDDLKHIKVMRQEHFANIPSAPVGSVYPSEEGRWLSNLEYLVTLSGTCDADPGQLGPYILDVVNLQAARR